MAVSPVSAQQRTGRAGTPAPPHFIFPAGQPNEEAVYLSCTSGSFPKRRFPAGSSLTQLAANSTRLLLRFHPGSSLGENCEVMWAPGGRAGGLRKGQPVICARAGVRERVCESGCARAGVREQPEKFRSFLFLKAPAPAAGGVSGRGHPSGVFRGSRRVRPRGAGRGEIRGRRGFGPARGSCGGTGAGSYRC